MERRSPPQKRIDDHAFPVRVKVVWKVFVDYE